VVETARGDGMRLRGLVLIFVALTVVVTLAACSSSGQSSDKGGKEQAGKDASGEQAQKQKPPEKASEGKKESAKKGTPNKEPPRMSKEAKSKQIAPKKGKARGKVSNALEPPKDKTLKLTIPEMKQIEDDTIPTGKGTNEALFRDHAAVHLRDTGFPWQRTANVYIAGHRIGFPGTDSNLAFYDLEDLKKGDKVYLEDAEGRKYTYQVFGNLVVEPTNLSVLRPIKGKNIVSLQTCTLPDYTNRVIYRAVLRDVKT
jgi:sortase A